MDYKERLDDWLERAEDWADEKLRAVKELFGNIYLLLRHGSKSFVRTEEYRRLQAENQTAQKQIQDTQTQYQLIQTRYKELEEELQTTRTELGTENATLRGKQGKLEVRVEELERLVSHKEQAIQELNRGIMTYVQRAIMSEPFSGKKYPKFIVFLDSRNRVMGASPRTLKLLGYEENEIVKEKYTKFLAEDDITRVANVIYSTLASQDEQKQADSLEISIQGVKIRRKNSKLIPLDMHAIILYQSTPITKKVQPIGTILVMDRIGYVRRIIDAKRAVHQTLIQKIKEIKYGLGISGKSESQGSQPTES